MDNYSSLLILGRQPMLGLAELESIFGADKVRPAGTEAALLAVAPGAVNFARLGGSVKLCKVLSTVHTTAWPEVQRELEQIAPHATRDIPSGKLQLGLSAYGLNVRPQQLMAAGLTLKKALRANGRSVRLVPNQAAALNSAQVLHNQLTNDHGREFVLIRDTHQTIIAQTIAEQDIESYTLRDRGRPKRDARVGMLPPKLAQIIVNLATGDAEPKLGTVVLDPFCGTGVVLQEANLTGFDVYGSDLEPRMVEYTQENLHWLEQVVNHGASRNDDYSPKLEIGDATTHTWQPAPNFVACETYLGQPFSTFPTNEKLQQVRGTCNVILEKFLTNIEHQLRSGTRLCLAVPAWQEKAGKFIHLPLIDRLSDLGYNRVRFEYIRNEQLLYYREDQIVARELLVLTRK